MRFAHLADVHIGSWRDPAMKRFASEALGKAVSIIIEKKLDFVIIAGDIFNTAIPAIDHLQDAVVQLKRLKRQNIAVYVVPGSHDYNAGGRTIIDVLEEADLLVNVMKGSVTSGKLNLSFTVDARTGVKLAGIGGRRGSLEKHEYSVLDNKPLEDESGQKIFVFHTAVEELKPENLQIDSISAKEFPRGFEYYAGGHVHIVATRERPGYKNLVYPGPLFPASFSELWKLGHGGFYIYDSGLRFEPICLKEVKRIEIDGDGKAPEAIQAELAAAVNGTAFDDAIVMLSARGKLAKGRPSDIDFKLAVKEIYARHAYFVMRNTSQLTSEEFTEAHISSVTADELEEQLITNGAKGKLGFAKGEAPVIRELLGVLSQEQNDGEKRYEYDTRLQKKACKVLEIEDV